MRHVKNSNRNVIVVPESKKKENKAELLKSKGFIKPHFQEGLKSRGRNNTNDPTLRNMYQAGGNQNLREILKVLRGKKVLPFKRAIK